jgi:DNA-binding NarL/FixJ family response regulator
MIRVLIADNQPRARRSLQTLLTAIQWSSTSGAARSDRLMEIVGEATDGPQVIDQVQMLQPEVVVMDLNLPRLDGLTVIGLLRRQWPEIRIVVLTMYATDRVAALEAGADAFLLKGCPTGELLAEVRPSLR